MSVEEPVLVDTGPLVAMFNERDEEHSICMNVFDSLPVGKVYTCWPVLTEAVYLAAARLKMSNPSVLLDAVMNFELEILHIEVSDIHLVQDVFKKYADQQVDLADAALVHLAHRENIRAIFTTDRRHFRVYQRTRGGAFRLLPDDFDD